MKSKREIELEKCLRRTLKALCGHDCSDIWKIDEVLRVVRLDILGVLNAGRKKRVLKDGE